MQNADVGHLHDIVPNDSDPVNVINDESDDDVINDDVMTQEQSERHSNACGIVDTTSQVEYDDLGNLFEEI